MSATMRGLRSLTALRPALGQRALGQRTLRGYCSAAGSEAVLIAAPPRMRVIDLHRPSALNALNHEMISTLLPLVQPTAMQPPVMQPALEPLVLVRPTLMQPALEQQALVPVAVMPLTLVQPALVQPVLLQPALVQPALEQQALVPVALV